MKRIFPGYAYGPGPRDGCHWDQTCNLPTFPALKGKQKADVVVLGAGFTGLNAALTLAMGGLDVIVLDAEQPGWGASGRNGGFCCLGGGKADDAFLDRHFGQVARLEWRQTEMRAVDHVQDLITQHDWAVDQHSQGETLLAHRPMSLDDAAEACEQNYGLQPNYPDTGDFGGSFFAAITVPHGFGLNPRKYLSGLLKAAVGKGVRVFGSSPGRGIEGGVETAAGQVSAGQTVVATNGYSSEDMPDWLGGRFMPAQSNVLVTRPLTAAERAAQGWQSRQMCYDTRNLLHYFRLMPDDRFLFGMRGGLFSGSRAEARARQRLRHHFATMFPAWADVAVESAWSGLVALARGQMPFVGQVPGQTHVYASLCYHGNGVAMGSFCGHLLGRLMLGDDERPTVLKQPLKRFPFGRARRVLMPPLYAGLAIADRI